MARDTTKKKTIQKSVDGKKIKSGEAEEPTRPETLERVARWYYIEERSQKEIAKELGKSDASAVARLIKEAVERRVVEFNIDGTFAIGGREDLTLSRQLRDEFGLEGAMVVHPDNPPSRFSASAEDDFVHVALANIAGLTLRDRIHPNDRLGVGPGRAVYQCTRMIKRRPPSRKGVRIIPLSGRILPRFWETSGPLYKRPLDADDCARMLAYAFDEEPGTKFTQVSHPLFESSKDEAIETMNILRVFLPDDSWAEEWAPRMAITGIGVTDPEGGHRFADIYHRPRDEADPLLVRAIDDLREIMDFVSKNDLPHCGDVSNRLFPSLPLTDRLAHSQHQSLIGEYDKLINKLNVLNQRIVAIGWKHLHNIPTVVAIAGGRLKLNAIWTILITGAIDPSKRVITELITDTVTARKLIGEIEKYKNDESLAAWYREMTQKLFTS